MRWVGLVVVGVLLALGWFAYNQPADKMLGFYGGDLSELVYLVMVLLLVSGAGFGFRRIRHDRGRAVAGAVFWVALLAAIVMLFRVFT